MATAISPPIRNSLSRPATTPNLLATSGSALLRWEGLLEAQVDLFLPFELQLLIGLPAWQEVVTALDVGRGNGEYIGRLSQFFPEKRFTGIDVSPELIGAARARRLGPNVDFVLSDFFSYRPNGTVFDAILMRLTLQHFEGIERVLAHAENCLARRGSLFIIESDPSRFRNRPETPKFAELLRVYEAATAAAKKNRSRLSELADLLASASGFVLADDFSAVVPHIGPFQQSRLLQMFLLWLDVFEASGVVRYDFAEVRKELEVWAANSAAYNQVGIKILRLCKAET